MNQAAAEHDPKYERYPLVMTHAAYTAPEVVKGEATNRPHQAEKFPPVTVYDETQEGYHTAQGYEPAGKIDPAAWVRSHAAPLPPNYEPVEFPKWVKGKLCANAAEEKAALNAAPDAAEAPQTAEPAFGDMRSMMERMAALEAQNATLMAEADALKKKEAQRERMAAARAARKPKSN